MNEQFLSQVVWSDEVIFKVNRHVYRHNSIYWSKENPHLFMHVTQQLLGFMSGVTFFVKLLLNIIFSMLGMLKMSVD